jgi:TRAP-type mannitol/chloroaromatic compound transport system permease small subunit
VDIIHGRLSARTRAWLDVATSFFFFLFVGAMTYTSAVFFLDSWRIREHSFTDWGPPYYPVKFTIPVAFFMLGLQGLVKLIRDSHIALTGRSLA